MTCQQQTNKMQEDLKEAQNKTQKLTVSSKQPNGFDLYPEKIHTLELQNSKLVRVLLNGTGSRIGR